MKTKQLENIKMEIEPSGRYFGYFQRTLEEQAKESESWAKDLEDFIRDHRSQDGCSIEVIREYIDICSHCGREWDEDGEGRPWCCNKAQQEFEENKKEDLWEENRVQDR